MLSLFKKQSPTEWAQALTDSEIQEQLASDYLTEPYFVALWAEDDERKGK